jgi:hypothetical protein
LLSSAALRHLASLGSSVPYLLSRRTNLKSLAEIEAERRAPRQREGNWRNGINPEVDDRWRRTSPKERAERDIKIRELWLAGKTYQQILCELDLPYGTVQTSIHRQGLRGKGGSRKSGWRGGKRVLPPATTPRRASVLDGQGP